MRLGAGSDFSLFVTNTYPKIKRPVEQVTDIAQLKVGRVAFFTKLVTEPRIAVGAKTGAAVAARKRGGQIHGVGLRERLEGFSSRRNFFHVKDEEIVGHAIATRELVVHAGEGGRYNKVRNRAIGRGLVLAPGITLNDAARFKVVDVGVGETKIQHEGFGEIEDARKLCLFNVHLCPAVAKYAAGDLHVIGRQGVGESDLGNRYLIGVIDRRRLTAKGGHRQVGGATKGTVGLALGGGVVVIHDNA